MKKIDDLTPKKIVEELDTYIIGQNDAKKAVAIALRNRARRKLVDESIKDEIAPKNIIMIGPTGVGKTEIARRLAKLCHAPFVKVEATKYTEVGYVGRDVESIIRDLVTDAVNIVKTELKSSVEEEAAKRTEEIILNALLPGSKTEEEENNKDVIVVESASTMSTKDKFREMLRNGKLNDRIIEISVTSSRNQAVEMFSGAGFEAMGINLNDLGGMFGGAKAKKKKVSVEQAKKLLLDEEIDKLIDMDKVAEVAIDRAENDGIVFVDEIDKVAVKKTSGTDVSREGVQRDLLPIVEGSKVNTKYGAVKTDHILFIAAGAFHISKPSDLIPELQGRFPIRVELNSLTKSDFIEILSKPKNALILQYKALLETEGINLDFDQKSIEAIAEYAYNVNSDTENIGARRLHTIVEKLLEDISFNAPDMSGESIMITKEHVDGILKDISADKDLSKYIL